jgi:hypothetical protein
MSLLRSILYPQFKASPSLQLEQTLLKTVTIRLDDVEETVAPLALCRRTHAVLLVSIISGFQNLTTNDKINNNQGKICRN